MEFNVNVYREVTKYFHLEFYEYICMIFIVKLQKKRVQFFTKNWTYRKNVSSIDQRKQKKFGVLQKFSKLIKVLCIP